MDDLAQSCSHCHLKLLYLLPHSTKFDLFKVLLGDHLQLPPTVFLPNADELFVSRSLFERLCVLGISDALEDQVEKDERCRYCDTYDKI